MALKIRCPSCGAALSAPDSYHGKSIKCPKCNSTFPALTEEEKEKEKERLHLEYVEGVAQLTPEAVAAGLIARLVEFCSNNSLLKTRQSLQIPDCAENFGSEIFYLYVFLMSESTVIAYADRPDFSVSVLKRLMDKIHSLFEQGTLLHLQLSSELLEQRYGQYADIRSHGLDYLFEHLPFTFFVTNGVIPSNRKEHIDLVAPLLTPMSRWVAAGLKSLCEAQREVRNKYLH